MPPSAIVASKAMANDPRAEPKYCERVPYVVVAGPVGARLMDLVSDRGKSICGWIHSLVWCSQGAERELAS